MEALTLTRQDYHEGLDRVDEAVVNDKAYLDQFKVEFPEGLNTANTMEICNVIQDSSFESKVHLMRICIAGKTVVLAYSDAWNLKRVCTRRARRLRAYPRLCDRHLPAPLP